MTHIKISLKFLFTCLIFTFLIACQNKSANQDNKNSTLDPKSMEGLNLAIVENPKQADLYFQRAQLFLKKNVQSQAFNDLLTATKLDSTNTQYLMVLADVAFKTFQIKKASETFERVVKIDPQNKEAYLKLAELYFYTKGYQKGLLYTNEALKIDKQLSKAYSLRAFIYKEMGDTAKAVSSFNTVLDLLNDDYDTYIQLGNIYAVRLNSIALQYYNNALRVYPNSTEALYNRGLYYQNKNELAKATADYLAIIKLDPGYSDAFFNLGYINSVIGKNYQEAIDFYSDAIRTNANYAEAFYQRGVCYENLGNKIAAVKDYNAALGIVPTYKPALQKLNRK